MAFHGPSGVHSNNPIEPAIQPYCHTYPHNPPTPVDPNYKQKTTTRNQAIFLDESAGQCCHSGCDNCEWRYDFDVMRAARPKWLVTYQERKFDSDAHRAKWVREGFWVGS